jgi:hypothetical protein
MSIKIYEDEIQDEFEGCSYCAEPMGSKISCCGEIHTATYFDIGDGCYYTADEVTILPGARPLTEEQLWEKEMEMRYESKKDEF